jgi:hypothetical protein
MKLFFEGEKLSELALLKNPFFNAILYFLFPDSGKGF